MCLQEAAVAPAQEEEYDVLASPLSSFGRSPLEDFDRTPPSFCIDIAFPAWPQVHQFAPHGAIGVKNTFIQIEEDSEALDQGFVCRTQSCPSVPSSTTSGAAQSLCTSLLSEPSKDGDASDAGAGIASAAWARAGGDARGEAVEESTATPATPWGESPPFYAATPLSDGGAPRRDFGLYAAPGLGGPAAAAPGAALASAAAPLLQATGAPGGPLLAQCLPMVSSANAPNVAYVLPRGLPMAVGLIFEPLWPGAKAEALQDPALQATRFAARCEPPSLPGSEAGALEPQLARQPERSLGSANHGQGDCKPCAWFWRAEGCQRGMDCWHCHLCLHGSLKARRKVKAHVRRDEKQRFGEQRFSEQRFGEQ